MNNNPDPLDFDDLRANVVQRVIDKMKLADTLKAGNEQLAAFADKETLINPGRRHLGADINGVMNHIELVEATIRDDIYQDISQLGFLIARDVIAEAVRAPQEGLQAEPVVFITGNRYMPPFRSFDDMEAIWQADEEGEYVVALWERVEECCRQNEIFLAQPDYDNALYGVDRKVWETSEAVEKDEPIDNLNDEWTRRDGM